MHSSTQIHTSFDQFVLQQLRKEPRDFKSTFYELDEGVN